jgi:serine/threonine protein kinase
VAGRLSHDIHVGQLLDRRFEITALIERSGMAKVYKALDCQSHQPVILKVPQVEFEGSPANSARFARETAIIGKLDHPGILKIIPVPEKTRPYIVMEYLEGETLADILERTRPLAESQAVRLASRLCRILEYVHRQGIVHCDVKPGNIMIADDGQPHLIDFGIARMRDSFTFGWFAPRVGTPEYMAPEQIQGDPVDARTDIYGLGVVLYEIVTGRRPSSEKLRSPRELNENLSEPIEEIILHAMAPNPADRYCSAAAMKMELDCLEKVQVTGKYKNPRKPSPWPKRFRLGAIVLSLAASPVILFFLFLLMFQRRVAR